MIGEGAAAAYGERVVRICLDHKVPLIEDTLTCPRGNHPVKRWGTVERSRFTSTKPRFIGSADVDDNQIEGAGAPLKEAGMEEKKRVVHDPLRELVSMDSKKPGVHERAKYKDAAGNVLWIHVRKNKAKSAAPWRVTWTLVSGTGKRSQGISAEEATEVLAREAFSMRRKASRSAGWDELPPGGGRGRNLVLTEPPAPPRPVKR